MYPTIFQEQLDHIVVPEPGTVAIFQHKIRHEGAIIGKEVTYAIRTEAIYGIEPSARPPPIYSTVSLN